MTQGKKPLLTLVAGGKGPTADARLTHKPVATRGSSQDSKVIRDCVVYAQSVAAWNAGFRADPTGDCDYAGTGDYMKKAAAALRRLIANSPDTGPTRDELFAKATVLRVMFAAANDTTGGEERAYARFFAAEVMAYCAGDET